MWDYLKQHENLMAKLLDQEASVAALPTIRAFHEKQIQFLQHERLIHLLVTLFVCLFFLLSFGFLMVRPSVGIAAIAFLFLVLTCGYLLHYFRLENGVQRLYGISNRVDARLSGMSELG